MSWLKSAVFPIFIHSPCYKNGQLNETVIISYAVLMTFLLENQAVLGPVPFYSLPASLDGGNQLFSIH